MSAPSYKLTTSTVLPAYEPPVFYCVNGNQVSPLLDVQHLKGHLSLLHAFESLRARRRWAIFVAFAVERFTLWTESFQHILAEKLESEDTLPPVDVLMILHAYLLNPWWFSEDTGRIPNLCHLRDFADTLPQLLPRLPDLLANPVTAKREHHWVTRCAGPFDLFEWAEKAEEKTLCCPVCLSEFKSSYLTANGDGYFQEGFKRICELCKKTVTKKTFGISRLLQDLQHPDVLIAGTELPTLSNSEARFARARMIKARMLAGLQGLFSDEVNDKNVLQNFQPIAIWKRIGENMKGQGGQLIGRIMAAYSTDKIFSVDLVGAVLRQGSFTSKMHELGWTAPHYFDTREDERALILFADSLTLSPLRQASLFVPTLDIDLAWHTHQLMSTRYREDCSRLIGGRFVDHDDKIVESTLSTAFDVTCRVWFERFGIRYAYCGCTIPGTVTVGQRLSKILSSSKPSKPPAPPYLAPPSHREDVAAATHPSDHNAVFPAQHRAMQESARKERIEKAEKRFVKESKKLKLTEEGRAVLQRRDGHQQAFLVPVPMTSTPTAPCAAGFGGGFVGAGGGCAVGAGACGGSSLTMGGGGCGIGSAGGCGDILGEGVALRAEVTALSW
ncbi:hypothetical protein DL96DRAFT_1818361 [Flagelloscypha sp. PMI_526]|nr:hypothetical protein DL96DRAFT_1818361 [Flagelloscypha sp. PMI_526]